MGTMMSRSCQGLRVMPRLRQLRMRPHLLSPLHVRFLSLIMMSAASGMQSQVNISRAAT